MLINDIGWYIENGFIPSRDFDVVIKIPEQKGRRILCFDTSHAFRGEDICEMIGIESFSGCMFCGPDAVKFIKMRYPVLPYQIKDKGERRWRIKDDYEFQCYDDSQMSQNVVEGTIIDFREELRPIIEHCRPPKEKKRSERWLGQIYRYNKLLIENGFQPEEFEGVREKRDILRMLDFDNRLTLSEIRLNYNVPGAIFERDGEQFIVDNNKELVNSRTGRGIEMELGWKVIIWNTTEFPQRY